MVELKDKWKLFLCSKCSCGQLLFLVYPDRRCSRAAFGLCSCNASPETPASTRWHYLHLLEPARDLRNSDERVDFTRDVVL